MNKKYYAIELKKNDLGPLFIDILAIDLNSLSPFSGLLTSYKKGSGKVTPEVKSASVLDQVKNLAKIIAKPNVSYFFQSGGGSLGFSAMNVLCNTTLDDSSIATVVVVPNDGFIIQLFADATEFSKWFCKISATNIEIPRTNTIPPKVSLESFIYLLHSIDSYRRITYENLLNYQVDKDPKIKVSEFNKHLELVLQKKDPRWLLPTFMMITPNMSQYKIEPKLEDMKILEQNKFVSTIVTESKEAYYKFEEAGLGTGVEFLNSWILATGFEAKILGSNGEEILIDRGFMVPTSYSNHFVRLDVSKQDKCYVNHQAMTFTQVKLKIADLISQAINMVKTSSNNAKSEAAPKASNTATMDKPKFCTKCGKPTYGGLKICSNCEKAK